MGKFYGVVGYAVTEETSPGVWTKQVYERSYYGDVRKVARRLMEDDKINDDVKVNNEVSIVADPFAMGHFFDILYIEWGDLNWKVSSVTVEYPRLVLTLGGLWNG